MLVICIKLPILSEEHIKNSIFKESMPELGVIYKVRKWKGVDYVSIDVGGAGKIIKLDEEYFMELNKYRDMDINNILDNE